MVGLCKQETYIQAWLLHLQVHTFDHTLTDDVRDEVANTPGINFHPLGVGSPSTGTSMYHFMSELACYAFIWNVFQQAGHILTCQSSRLALICAIMLWPMVTLAGLQTLEQIMKDLGHEWVDLLKIDIEFHEWELFADFYSRRGASLPATQILVEFHFQGLAKTWATFDHLLADNYRIFSVEPNYYCVDGNCGYPARVFEYAFIKVTSSGHICAPLTDASSGKIILPHGCRPGDS